MTDPRATSARYRCPGCRKVWNLAALPFRCRCGQTILADAEPLRTPPGVRAGQPRRQVENRAECVHRGDELRQEECPSCAGKIKIKIFGCQVHRECTLGKQLQAIACCKTCGDFRAPIRWLATADLVRDTLALIAALPPDLAGVVGVPRSGMLPASVIATQLHLPLFAWQQDAVVPVGHGFRLSNAPDWRGPGPALVIDDTSYGGNTSRQVRERWRRLGTGRQLIFAAVYTAPAKDHTRGPMPDLAAAELEPPHFLEWNFFNSTYVPSAAFDFDGVFTIDGTTRPQHLPRKWPVELIVTGRLERDRAGSEAWLREHGINFKRLVMYPGSLAERDQPGEIARYKAQHFLGSGLKWFVESDADQATDIARLSGKPVLCPPAGKVF